MGIGLIAGAGLAIAASVGPARQWRGALHARPEAVEPVERSGVEGSESGVPGSIVPNPPGYEVVVERVPLQELLIKKPSAAPSTTAQKKDPIVVAKKRPAGTPVPVVVVLPPREPEKRLAIPTNTSSVPPSTTQKTERVQIRTDGPTESAEARRPEVVTTKGAGGWNKVEITTTGFEAANPARAAEIDRQREVKEAPLKGKTHAVVYVGVDPRDQDSSMSPRKTTTTLDVHDSQLHLFEPATQTQARLDAARQAMANGNAGPMQSIFQEIGDASAAARVTRVVRGGNRRGYGPMSFASVSTNPGPMDPRLAEDGEDSAATALTKLSGVERYKELLARGASDSASEYLQQYVVDNADDGRAQLVLGLQDFAARRYEPGLKSLARACDLGAAAFSEPLDLAALGIMPSKVADALGRMLGQKEQLKGYRAALGLASAAYAVGRPEAVKRLLDQAVSLGMDPADAATLTGLWKIRR